VSNPAKYIAAVFGLTGFVVASVAGLIVGNPSEVILMRAILAMFACFVCGLPMGAAAGWTVEQYITSFKNQKTAPVSGDDAGRVPKASGPPPEIAPDGVMIV
jgi:hypothetical protein